MNRTRRARYSTLTIAPFDVHHQGGAVYAYGAFTATDCDFTSNSAVGTVLASVILNVTIWVIEPCFLHGCMGCVSPLASKERELFSEHRVFLLCYRTGASRYMQRADQPAPRLHLGIVWLYDRRTRGVRLIPTCGSGCRESRIATHSHFPTTLGRLLLSNATRRRRRRSDTRAARA